LSRRRKARLRLHGLSPHRRRRARRRLQRLGLDRNLRRGPAHRADEALRRRQAQPDHHALHPPPRAPPPAGMPPSAPPPPAPPPVNIAETQCPEALARHGTARTRATRAETPAWGGRPPRAALAALPDGEWSFEDFIAEDGIGLGKPIRLFVTIRKNGGAMTV